MQKPRVSCNKISSDFEKIIGEVSSLHQSYETLSKLLRTNCDIVFYVDRNIDLVSNYTLWKYFS